MIKLRTRLHIRIDRRLSRDRSCQWCRTRRISVEITIVPHSTYIHSIAKNGHYTILCAWPDWWTWFQATAATATTSRFSTRRHRHWHQQPNQPGPPSCQPRLLLMLSDQSGPPHPAVPALPPMVKHTRSDGGNVTDQRFGWFTHAQIDGGCDRVRIE